MAEHLLNGAQIAASVEKMSGERMAQCVRAHPPGEPGSPSEAPLPTPPELVLLSGVGHFFHGRLSELKNVVVGWLQKQSDGMTM